MIKNHARRSGIDKNIAQMISWRFRGHRTKSRQDMGENDYLGSSINMSFWPENTWWMISKSCPTTLNQFKTLLTLFPEGFEVIRPSNIKIWTKSHNLLTGWSSNISRTEKDFDLRFFASVPYHCPLHSDANLSKCTFS